MTHRGARAHIEARLRGFGWPFGPFGPGAHGPHGPHGGRGRRGGRGNVRAAVLALLAERPMHGYEMITELEARTGGIWRPSPGSVYPTLQMLEDEGLITSEETDGRRRFALTDAGRTAAEQAGPAPWERPGDDDMIRNLHDIRDAGFGAVHAMRQIMTSGTADQRRRAIEIIDEARKKLYAILAE